MPLEIKNGKFYRDGELIPTEIGNKEQIELMKKELEYITALNNDGISIDVEVEEVITYRASGHFRCKCGKILLFESHEFDGEYDSLEGLNETEKTCRNCNKTYIILRDEDDESDTGWSVKLKSSAQNGKTSKK